MTFCPKQLKHAIRFAASSTSLPGKPLAAPQLQHLLASAEQGMTAHQMVSAVRQQRQRMS